MDYYVREAFFFTSIISGQAWGPPSYNLFGDSQEWCTVPMLLDYFKSKTKAVHLCFVFGLNAPVTKWGSRSMNDGLSTREHCKSSPLWCFPEDWWGSWERRRWIRCLSLHHKAGGQWSLPVSTGCLHRGLDCPNRRTSPGLGSSLPSGTAVDQRERERAQ